MMTLTPDSDAGTYGTPDHVRNGRLIDDYKVMIDADARHLVKALERGDRVAAHGFVDAIIDNSRNVEDVIARSE
jgi:hypothetical protein